MKCYKYILVVLLVNVLRLANSHIFNDIFGRDNLVLNTLSRQEKCETKLPDNTQLEGICKTRTECLLTGGIPRGGCGLLSTCCAYTKGCGRTANTKVSYFSSGLNFVPSELCTFNVLRANENICQVRLDFLAFQTTPPVEVNLERQCGEDNFFVAGYRDLPGICGLNTGQHIYLHLPDNMKDVSLNMQISKTNPNAYWNIKVTQLECPRKDSILTKVDKELVNDYSVLAPARCLQYFISRSGNIRSFGFDPTRINSYASYQKYAICFKRTDDICGINFRANRYNFQAGTPCTHYLEIPGINSSTILNGKLCGSNQPQEEFSTMSPGPLHIDFYAGSNQDGEGFNIAYDLKTCPY